MEVAAKAADSLGTEIHWSHPVSPDTLSASNTTSSHILLLANSSASRRSTAGLIQPSPKKWSPMQRLSLSPCFKSFGSTFSCRATMLWSLHLPAGLCHVRQRRIAIWLGATAAIALRVIFTLSVAQVLALRFVKIISGAVLIVIAIRLVEEEDSAKQIEPLQSIWASVRIIVVADVAMSLDNAVAIAAAAKGISCPNSRWPCLVHSTYRLRIDLGACTSRPFSGSYLGRRGNAGLGRWRNHELGPGFARLVCRGIIRSRILVVGYRGGGGRACGRLGAS